MTKDTPPMIATEWEPITEGIKLYLKSRGMADVYKLPMTTVRELRDDLEEALWLSRGYKKVECYWKDIMDDDRFTVVKYDFVVASVMEELAGWWVAQSRDGEEVRLYGDELVTIWRSIE